MKNKKALAFWGLRNAKYAKRNAGVLGTAAVLLPKGKSLALTASVNFTEVFANDERILNIPSDQGYTGTYGCTGQDVEFEEAIGILVKLDGGGFADVNLTDTERFEMYYEYTFSPEGARAFTMKAWIYGVELGKPSKTHNTKESSITVGDYSYPLTVFGETIMTPDGKQPYVDEDGNEKKAWIYYCLPGEENYKNFGDAPPKLVKGVPVTTPPDPDPIDP